MLAESDLYNSNTTPTNNVNPKSLGAMWINYTNGRYYICSNNTINKNVWLDPISILTNEINTNVNNKLQQTETKLTEKINNIKQLGYNQEWHVCSIDGTFTPSITRYVNVWYRNDTPAPIAVLFTSTASYGSGTIVEMLVSPPKDSPGSGPKYERRLMHDTSIDYNGRHGNAIGFVIVPPNFYYKVYTNTGLLFWSELR